jgi:hypothetical protein
MWNCRGLVERANAHMQSTMEPMAVDTYHTVKKNSH